jgi:2-iminoacetate synthase
MQPFIDVVEIESILQNAIPNKQKVEEVIAKSLDKKRLSLYDTAILLNATDSESVALIKQAARKLKEKIYGNRVVLFAPLYVGNFCMNNCAYCGFRTENKDAVRITLDKQQIIKEVEALEDEGQKRLIVVFGEHRIYTPEFIADTVRTVYNVKKGNGEIRRVNVNAAPLEIEGFRTVKEAGIGTYQIFQETYHPDAYKLYHPSGPKRDFNHRLTSLDRAQEAGLDDVGIGALFGLYDWRFEAMALVRHTNHLEACYNVGPHTISFPRLQAAFNALFDPKYRLDDADFVRMVAILRLAVPYTGLICTAREPAYMRKEVLPYGVSQIDGGTRLELGSYSEQSDAPQDLKREQFRISDSRTLQHVVGELLNDGYLPSFCTACYRKGRTGEHFMEFSVPGFIKRFCTPNAIFTLAEYLEDYASEEQKKQGYTLIEQHVSQMEASEAEDIRERLQKIQAGQRDLYL